MKIPKKLKVGAHIYTVKLVKSAGLAEGELGNTDIAHNKMVIDTNQEPDQVEETFIHEIFHAINNQLDHAMLESLAHQFHQVLRDNKLLR